MADYQPRVKIRSAQWVKIRSAPTAWKREVWRMAFAFDPKREAILLAAGNKNAADQKRFYRALIATADARFDAYLAALKAAEGRKKRKESSHGKKS